MLHLLYPHAKWADALRVTTATLCFAWATNSDKETFKENQTLLAESLRSHTTTGFQLCEEDVKLITMNFSKIIGMERRVHCFIRRLHVTKKRLQTWPFPPLIDLRKTSKPISDYVILHILQARIERRVIWLHMIWKLSFYIPIVLKC